MPFGPDFWGLLLPFSAHHGGSQLSAKVRGFFRGGKRVLIAPRSGDSGDSGVVPVEFQRVPAIFLHFQPHFR